MSRPSPQSSIARLRRIAPLAAAGVAWAALPVFAQLEAPDEIIREGVDERRKALNDMELLPFPMECWDLITDWQIADAPSPENLDDKVIVIMTFAGWYPPSMRSLAVVNRMAVERAADGLVVFGVHDADAWDEGVSAVMDRRVKFAIGHDSANEFREALLVDQDPDFYLIDRAGQLRFADIETSSLEAAVDRLLAETREEAATLLDRMADSRHQAEIAARRTARINQNANLASIPAVPFVVPGPEVYAAQRWPTPPRDPNNSSQPVETTARPIALPRDGWWPAQPTGLGRATVVYFFDRRISQTTTLIPKMDSLQRRYNRDIQVIGAMTPLFQDNSGLPTTTPPVDGNAVIRQTGERMGLAHLLVLDQTSALFNAAAGNQGFQFGGGTNQPRTLAAIASSDGVVRWFGDSTSTAFESAVDQIARIDPGVRARRAAEDEYLRQRGP